MGTMTLTEFLLARIAEDEAAVEGATHWHPTYSPAATIELTHDGLTIAPARVLAECAAKRAIVELHRDWPVLVEGPREFEPSLSDRSYVDQTMMRVTQKIAWMTEQQYRNRFGDEPPTGPIMRALVQPYADHPDFDDAWR